MTSNCGHEGHMKDKSFEDSRTIRLFSTAVGIYFRTTQVLLISVDSTAGGLSRSPQHSQTVESKQVGCPVENHRHSQEAMRRRGGRSSSEELAAHRPKWLERRRFGPPRRCPARIPPRALRSRPKSGFMGPEIPTPQCCLTLRQRCP